MKNTNKKYYIIVIVILLTLSTFLCITCIHQNNRIKNCDEYIYTSINNTIQTTGLVIDDGNYQAVIPLMSAIVDCAMCYSDAAKGHMLSDMVYMYIEAMYDDVKKKDNQELEYKLNSIKVINSCIHNDVDFDEIHNKIKKFTDIE